MIKNKFRTYLSLTNEYVGCRIGMAAERNAYDFTSPVLEPLRNLLFNVVEEEVLLDLKPYHL